ncbi:hypothetical protein H2201_002401 [Coniosporium apollinis]|uniref:Uncharacterized protein n=1 Tax=Coniosporium apollinis TaxID=61459 RepID=A0ABQ9NYS1_9PEZI|nr:hypothetical protein H2201_002401 [Coniosporium apollinis]
MESKLKKLLHRRSRKSLDYDATPPEARGTAPSDSLDNSPVRSTSYASTTAGRAPKTGELPLHGNSPRASKSMDKGRRRSSAQRPLSSPTGPNRNVGLEHPPGTAISDDDPRVMQFKPLMPGLEDDLRHLSLGGDDRFMTEPSRMRYSEDVARRNISVSPEPPSRPLDPQAGLYSEDVADRNMQQNAVGIDGGNNSVRRRSVPNNGYQSQSASYGAPQALTETARRKSMTRKPIPATPPAPAVVRRSDSTESFRSASTSPERHADLNKPLPSVPAQTTERQVPNGPRPLVEGGDNRTSVFDDAAEKRAQLLNVIDLRNTEDTTVHTKWAPAVTEEKVFPEVHYIEEQRITREIHNYDIYHRILPIIDVEVLPTRHFLPVEGGGLVEVDERDLPGRVLEGARRARNWVIAETVSKIPSDEPVRTVPRQFTARKFEGTEGDFKRYITPEGYERTETTWVHPPTTNDLARLTGQTYPMHFGIEGTEPFIEYPLTQKPATALDAPFVGREGVQGTGATRIVDPLRVKRQAQV